jgi:hypothetical protein
VPSQSPCNDALVRRALDLTQNKDGRESHRSEDKRFSSAALPRRICGEIISVFRRLAPLLASIALQSPPRSAARGARDALLPVPAAARTRAAVALLPPRLRRAPVPRPRAHLPPGAPAAASSPPLLSPRRGGSAAGLPWPDSRRDRLRSYVLLFVMEVLGAETMGLRLSVL